MGDYTYVKSDTKSPIDFALTDKNGCEHIQEFNIIQNDWHLADHKPIELKLLIGAEIDSRLLYRRSLELNQEVCVRKPNIHRCNKQYNYEHIETYLTSRQDEIDSLINHLIRMNNVDQALITLDGFLQDAHKAPGALIKKTKQRKAVSLTNVNKSYNNYRNILNSPSTDLEIEFALKQYLDDRKAINYQVLKDEFDL